MTALDPCHCSVLDQASVAGLGCPSDPGKACQAKPPPLCEEQFLRYTPQKSQSRRSWESEDANSNGARHELRWG